MDTGLLCKYCEAVLCNGCGHSLIDINAELQALRAWKEKAMPWIEANLEEVEESIKGRSIEAYEAGTKVLIEDHKELTELLGGDDEN